METVSLKDGYGKLPEEEAQIIKLFFRKTLGIDVFNMDIDSGNQFTIKTLIAKELRNQGYMPRRFKW